MIEKMKAFAGRRITSLRTKMVIVILAGAMLATLIYISTRFLSVTLIDSYYATDQARARREAKYIVNLQAYIDENNISSQDLNRLGEWVDENRGTYIMLYIDEDTPIYSGGIGESTLGSLSPVPGVSVDFPSLEQIKQYAKQNDLYEIRVSDRTIFASVSDFSEYFLYDSINMVSLIAAFVVLSVIMLSYFFTVTRRISTLSKNVTIVSDVDMKRSIKADGNDELATLSRSVEKMRSSIIENMEKEKAAMDANAELITSMSHDIRTPLTVLLGYIDLMKAHPTDETMQEYIRASESTALRLKNLSDDMFRYLLVFGGGDMGVEMDNYDARTLIEQLILEHIVLLTESGYNVETVREEDFAEGLQIFTDASKAIRVFDNVFSNMYKYADAESPIEFSIHFDKYRLWITIKNKIKAHADKSESTGIGLKTCEKIAEAIDMAFDYGAAFGHFMTKIGFKTVIGDKND